MYWYKVSVGYVQGFSVSDNVICLAISVPLLTSQRSTGSAAGSTSWGTRVPELSGHAAASGGALWWEQRENKSMRRCARNELK